MSTKDFSSLKLGSFNEYAGLKITFPANISREEVERMAAEIQAALYYAEKRGEQKALLKIAAKGG